MKKLLVLIAVIVIMLLVFMRYHVMNHHAPERTHRTQSAIVAQAGRTIVVMRHGQADHNVSHRFNSDPTSPNYFPAHLTERGKKQVQRTVDMLLDAEIDGNSVVAIYASPLPRTQETAALVQDGLHVPIGRLLTDQRLIEVQMGKKEGTRTYLLWNRSNAHQYGGETEEDVRQRVADFLVDIAKKHPTGTVIVVTHATPAGQIMSELGHYMPNPRQAQAEIIQLSPA